jgi:acetamidase/formamidase
MHTTITVDLIKGVTTPWPRIETDTTIMSIGCARPLEDAFRVSQHDLVGWVSTLTDLDILDAYQLVGQAGQAPVGNVCDPSYTLLAKIDKAHLDGGRFAYGGAHKRLREPTP